MCCVGKGGGGEEMGSGMGERVRGGLDCGSMTIRMVETVNWGI